MKLCNHLPAQGRKVHEGFSGHEEHLYPQQNGQDYHRLPSPDAPSLPRETATAQDDLPVIDMNDDDMGFLQYCRQENRVSLCDPNPSVPGSSENVPCPNPSSNLDFGSSFSRYCAPSSRSDTVLLAMVDEARKEHEHGRFDTTEPSLHQLLSDPPRDTLSFRLFHHLCGYGAMPLHLLLSIFWTQYLVLRWHVLRTSAALERVPEFLRPTPTERVIPHQFFIGMLVWPEIRLELIKQGNDANVESIGVALLQHLNPYWSSKDVQGMLPTMDVLSMIEKQSCSLQFWRIDGAFYTKYPQFPRVMTYESLPAA